MRRHDTTAHVRYIFLAFFLAACCDAPDPGCDDSVQNGAETDVDCGGPVCGPCDGGEKCLEGADCLSGLCSSRGCD